MRPRIKFANIVSVIALFVALGGTAIATHPGGQNTISTADIINGEVKVADIGQGQVAADELAANAVGASEIADGQVGAAEIATGAVRTEELRNGQVQAEDLAPGVAPGASGARAWGLVSSGGSLLRSRNVTSVTHPFDSAYCIDPGAGIDPTTAVMVVGEDLNAGPTSEILDDVSHAEWHSAAPDCPAGMMEVRTFLGNGTEANGGETDSGGFDVDQFDHGFTFVIP